MVQPSQATGNTTLTVTVHVAPLPCAAAGRLWAATSAAVLLVTTLLRHAGSKRIMIRRTKLIMAQTQEQSRSQTARESLFVPTHGLPVYFKVNYICSLFENFCATQEIPFESDFLPPDQEPLSATCFIITRIRRANNFLARAPSVCSFFTYLAFSFARGSLQGQVSTIIPFVPLLPGNSNKGKQGLSVWLQQCLPHFLCAPAR